MRNQKGFTLIELLVVIAIISLLSSVVLASLNTARKKARDAKRMSDMRQIQLALELYHSTYSIYPNIIAYVSPSVDTQWSTTLATILLPYLSSLPKETILGNGYLYSATNSGSKYGLATGMESPGNSSLMASDGGFYSTYYELGPSPADCKAVDKDWWGGIAINCP